MLHGALFLTDTDEEDSEIDGHSDTEGNPSIAKEGDTDKLRNDVEEIVGMAYRLEQEARFDTMIGYDIELKRPHIPQLIDDEEEHGIGKNQDRYAPAG